MDISQLRIQPERLHNDFDALSQIGATSEDGISRPALSLEDLEARAWFANRIEDAGFLVRDDDVGNLSGMLCCPQPDAPTLLIGSHLDTVPDGGRYDGAVGVLAGLEVLRTIRDAGLKLPFHLEIVDFTDEEGSWLSLLGSRGLTGRLPVGRLSDKRGEDGAFRAALARAGIDIEHIKKAARDPAKVAGYLEMHIEQAGMLDRLGEQIGVVRGIVGRTTYQVTFHGESGHSGTTDIYRRKDALQGAALFITRVHMLAHDRFDGSVINCGQLDVQPGMVNVIPSRAQLLVEARHVDEDKLLELEGRLLELGQECAQTYNLRLETQRVEHMDAAEMDAQMIRQIERVCRHLGLSYTSVTSYAGHDAQPLSAFTPSGMIFIPSVNGISHATSEFSRWEDVVNGTNVLLHTVLQLAYNKVNN